MNRKLYFGALLSAVAALVLARLFALPAWSGETRPALSESLTALTDSLLGGALAALAVSVLVLWLDLEGSRTIDEAVVIPPREISSEVAETAKSTNEWNYRGHTGRYFRAVILPLLVERANRHGTYITVCAQVLDPDDVDAVEFFARYRRSVNPDKASYWTVGRARAEILATIVELAICSVTTQRLSASTFLASSVSPFTVDMSSTLAVVTRESSSLAALKYPVGSSFFDSMKEDLHLSREQARRVPSLAVERDFEVETVEDLRFVLDEMDVGVGVGDELLRETLSAIRKPMNPYPHA